MSDGNNSPWKIILIVAGCLFALIRLGNSCSRINKQQYQNSNNAIEKKWQLEEERATAEKLLKAETSLNQILYTKYNNLHFLSQNEKNAYGIFRIEKDTLVNLDLSLKIKIPAKYYFQKNYDTSFKIAMKSPDELNIFIHDFEGKVHIGDSFRVTKKYMTLEDVKFEDSLGKSKTLSYKVSNSLGNFNGYTIALQNDNYLLLFEFESPNLDTQGLQKKSKLFLSQNLKIK